MWPRSSRVFFLTFISVLLFSAGAEAQNELYVTEFVPASILVHSKTASGNTAPLRTIMGSATGLTSPQGIAVDSVNGELFVADGPFGGLEAVFVYSKTASGNVAPLRTLTGATTGLSFILNESIGFAVDLTSNELIVTNPGNDSITVYSRTASGNAAPLRVLQGPATGLHRPEGTALDLTNNELIVTNSGNDTITVYSRTATGNTAPLRTLQGAATGLNHPEGIALDLLNNELVAANRPSNSVTAYSRAASGNAAPLRTLVGPATGLLSPKTLGVDLGNNELLVLNLVSITAYSRTASGNTAPLRTLQGPATGVLEAHGMAVEGTTSSPGPADAGIPILSWWSQVGLVLILIAVAAWRIRPRLNRG